MINMNSSAVLGASLGWIYVLKFDPRSYSCPRRNGQDMLACLRLATNARKEAMGTDDF